MILSSRRATGAECSTPTPPAPATRRGHFCTQENPMHLTTRADWIVATVCLTLYISAITLGAVAGL